MTTKNEFNQAVSLILALFAEYVEIPKEQIASKIMKFNEQLDNQLQKLNEKSIQLGQNDQTSNKHV